MLNTDTKQLAELPLGVVSTEAIEQLMPVVPAQTEQPLTSTRSGPRGVTSGLGQIVLTALPLVVTDVLVVLGCFFAGTVLTSVLVAENLHSNFVYQAIGVVGIFLTTASLFKLYPATGVSPVFELRQLVRAAFLGFGLMGIVNALVATLSLTEIIVFVIGGGIAMATLPLCRATVRQLVSKFDWWGERAIIIGAGVQGQAIYSFYQRATQRGLRPIGIVDRWEHSKPLVPKLDTQRFRYLGSIAKLSSRMQKLGGRWGIIAPGGCEGMDVTDVMRYCGDVPHLIVLPSQMMIPSLWANPRECAGVMGVHVTDHLRSPANAFVKRSVDLLGALVGLTLASPLFVIAILWTKWKSPGPAFYGHTRIGRDERPFKAWKFRTMVPNADQELEKYLEEDADARQEWIETQKLKNDPRVISGIGNFLRKTSLDEIPQLWNVLVGEMSLVGPRPIVRSEVERYQNHFPHYLRVRPGITGLWQVSGRNDTSYNQRVQLDSYYVCNWSPWLDTYILLRTIRTMLMREGAY